MTTLAFKAEGDAILLLGGHGSHLGQSIYLREVLGREEGAPPPVDLAKEKAYGDFVRSLINSRQVTAVHDISDGGLAATVIEMALASGLGAILDPMEHVALFAEDQARYILTCKASEAAKIITQAHVKAIDVIRIGTVTKAPSLNVGSTTTISLADLKNAHEGWFPGYMSGEL
jgi:phosphoribosylformylglycinamidine synthase